MRRILAFLTAVVISAGVIGGFHYKWAKSESIRGEGFKTWNSMYKDLSYEALSKNIDKDTVLLFGSSELNHSRKSPFHPSNFLVNHNVDAMLIGGAFNQSLYHTIALGALEQDLKDRKVVLILSPTWFYKKGISSERYSLRFSESEYLAFMENPNISHDIKKYVGDRSAKLLKANSDMKSQVEFYNKIYVDGHGSFFGKFLLPIRKAYLSDKEIFAINTAFEEKGYVIQKPKKATDTLSNKINYEKMLVKADSEEKNYPRENRFNMRQKSFNKLKNRVSSKYENSHAGDNFKESPEYGDLEMFFKICKERKIDAMVVLLPLNGWWYDYTGMPRSARETFRTETVGMAKKYGINVADFTAYDYDKDFLEDEVHPTGKGWLLIDEKIYDFYKGESN